MKHIKTFESFISEQEAFVPAVFDDARGKELYLKYGKANDDRAWKKKDNFQKSIKLDILMKLTGLTVDELVELSKYGDESWTLDVDTQSKVVTEYVD